MEIKDLEQIISILKQNDVSEFELQQGETHIRLSRAVRSVAVPAAGSGAPSLIEPAILAPAEVAAPVAPAAPPKPVPDTSGLTRVESPLVGTFYRRPSPEAEPFVKEGDQVQKGDTLCIVEAMKLMNEIEAPASGRIEKILIADGHVVEYGELLFLINPGA